MSEDHSKALVGRIRAGDPAAESELVHLFKRRVLILIYKNLGYQNPAGYDLLHEVMIAVVQALRSGHFDAARGTPLQAYVYGIARNKIRDHLKAEKKRVNLHQNLEREAHLNVREDVAYELKETMQLLRDAIKRLKPKYREIIYMRYFEELSIAEISEKTGLPRRRVSERINYAIKLLKKRAAGPDFSQ